MVTAQLEKLAKHLYGDLRKATKDLRMICVPTEIVTGDVLNRRWGRCSVSQLAYT
jgi:hypothetical protein